MSTATETQSIRDIINQEAEQVSQSHYHKPFAELDLAQQYGVLKFAKDNLRRRNVHIPGECCDCGARIAEDKYQCRPCHEGMRQSEWTRYHRRLADRGLL